MTRAPLPGKLPEWPEPISPDWHSMSVANYDRAVIAYWESRARLAVEALQVIKDTRSDFVRGDATDAEYAAITLKEIGPLPEEDRT